MASRLCPCWSAGPGGHHGRTKQDEKASKGFRSDRLPDPVVLNDGDQVRNVTGFIVDVTFLDDQKGQGTITFEEDILAFNDFGDATRTGGKEPATYPIQLRICEADDTTWGRKLYDLVFADGRLPEQFRFVRYPEPAAKHQLIFRGDQHRFIELRGSKIGADALGNNPQQDLIHFETLAFGKNLESGKGQPKGFRERIIVRGSLSGQGYLELDPNYLTFNSFGEMIISTCIGWTPIPVAFKLLEVDPARQGRRAFSLLAKDSLGNRSYVLVVAPTELGPHRLIIKEDGKVRQALPLRDTERDTHLYLQRELAQVPAAEAEVIAQLRKICGYRFKVSLNKGNVASLLLLEGDIGQLDPILKPLKHLKGLDFSHARLPATGLTCLEDLRDLAVLSFYFCEINDTGLAPLKHTPKLKHLTFFGCQGPSARGLAHLEKLTNLEMLHIRREDQPHDIPILDDGLKYLHGMKKLTSLNLDGQRITDAGLVHLGALTSLEELFLISGESLTEAGLKNLEGLQNLRRCRIYSPGFPSQAWKAFRAKLPKLEEKP